jgi:fatty-acyl-CoA synthase
MTSALPSYASGVSDVPLLGETIGQNLERTVAAYGDREALVEMTSGRRWTYEQFNREVDVVARGLLAKGIGKGDRVGIWAPNCAEWTITQYATAKIGAILVNVNPAYRTHELSYALNQSGVKLLI